MSFQGVETFDINSGQFSETGFPGRQQGSLAFTGGQGVVTNGSGLPTWSSIFIYTASGDPTSGSYVAIDLDGLVTGPGSTFASTNPGFYKDGSNYVYLSYQTQNTVNTQLVCSCVVGGVVSNFVISGSVANPSYPNRYATAMSGNVFSIYSYSAGVWSLIGSKDLSLVHDFTAPGALVGWRAGFSVWSDVTSGTAVATVDNLQWGAVSDLLISGFYPPTGLGGSVVPGPAVQLSWTASVPFIGNPLTQPPEYLVYRGGVNIGAVSTAGITSFIDTSVLSGPTYTYTVAAADSLGNPISGQSAPITISTSPVLLSVPFVSDATYKPIMLANVKGIKPRVYVPIQSNTVSTKQ